MSNNDLIKFGISRDHCYETLMEVWSRAPQTKIQMKLAGAIMKIVRLKKK